MILNNTDILVGFRLLNKIIIPSEKYLDKCISLCKEGYLLEKENGYIQRDNIKTDSINTLYKAKILRKK